MHIEKMIAAKMFVRFLFGAKHKFGGRGSCPRHSHSYVPNFVVDEASLTVF